jgi:predicted AlkP superfamily phosphohydrolase/phosphomutase
LADKIARKTALASFLLAMRRWDVFAFYFGESDTAAHNLWSLFDEGSPRRPAQVTSEEALGLARVYEALDRAVGRLVREAGDDVEVTIVSDHGSGGSSDKVVHINRALEQAGLLCFRPRGRSWSLGLRGLALSKLPPPVRERAFRLGNAALPGLLESRVRFGRIDMTRTVAFSDELNYFPAVWLNVRGREPSGLVDPSHVAEARQRVTEALLSLRDPFTDRPIVHAVHPREALFSGPFLERAPDLLLELRLSRGYSYNLVPTPVDDERVVRRLGPDEYLGKKGRSLPGAHRPQGLFIAAGRTVLGRGQIESSIRDAASLTLSRIGVTPPHEAPCAGAVLAPDELRELAPAPAPSPVATRRSRLHERLRALGYID